MRVLDDRRARRVVLHGGRRDRHLAAGGHAVEREPDDARTREGLDEHGVRGVVRPGHVLGRPADEDRRVEALGVAGDVVVVVLARAHEEARPERGIEERRRGRADAAADRRALDGVAADDRATELVALGQADLADGLPEAELPARGDDGARDGLGRDRDVGAEAVVRVRLVVGHPRRDLAHERRGLLGDLGGELRLLGGHDRLDDAVEVAGPGSAGLQGGHDGRGGRIDVEANARRPMRSRR